MKNNNNNIDKGNKNTYLLRMNYFHTIFVLLGLSFIVNIKHLV